MSRFDPPQPPADPATTEADQRQAAALAARKTERSQLAARLTADGEEDLADILEGCGTPLKLHCVCCGVIKVVEQRCRKRWCPVCARQISAKRVAKYAGAVARMQWPIFATLTRPNLRTLTLDHIREMRRGFRRLRQRRWWSQAVVGGIASVEITNTGKGWHPHLHAILDAKWLAKTVPPLRPHESHRTKAAKCKQAATEVAAEWAHAMRLPVARVHVKRAYGARDIGPSTGDNASIAVEVLKYSVKAADLIACPEPIGDLIRLLGAARLVSTWGSMYGRKLDDEPDEGPRPSCECGAHGSLVPDDVVNIWTRQAWDRARGR